MHGLTTERELMESGHAKMAVIGVITRQRGGDLILGFSGRDRFTSTPFASKPIADRATERIVSPAWARVVVTILLLVGPFAAATWAVEKPSLDPNGEVEVAADLSEHSQLRKDLEYLASDELRGRGVGSDSIDMAANYIAQRFRQAGLRTDLFGDSPFQPVEISLGSQAGPMESNRLTVYANDEDTPRLKAVLGDGLTPLAIGSDRGRVQGPLAFVGYGIRAPDLNYDDYAGIGVEGCIVMMIRKEPGHRDPQSPFDGTRATRHALFSSKIRLAIARGAAAVILVNDPASVAASTDLARRRLKLEEDRLQSAQKQVESLPWEAVQSRAKMRDTIERLKVTIEDMKLELRAAGRGLMDVSTAGRRRRNQASVPVISIGRDEADALLRQTGKVASLADWEAEVDRTYRPKSFFLSGLMGKLQIEMTPSSRVSNNVIGTIDGRGPLANESIVVGAHYDHVGLGGYGSLAPGTIAIHNGADDNASGTAALIAIAQQLKRRLAGAESYRRVIAIAFTGEERGLVGSRHYVRHPRFDLSSTVSMINLDMVGRLRDNELTVYGTGSGDQLDEILSDANQRGGFNLFKVSTGFGPSDHQSFYERGVPVLFFFTGLHQDYHRPSDDSEKINFTGLNRITDTVCDVAFDLATRSQAPQHQSTEDKGPPIRRQLTAVMGVRVTDSDQGVMISGFHPESAAREGGVQIGDRLDRIGKIRVQSSVDVLEVLRNRNPGDLVRLRLTREGRPIETTFRLDTRP